MDYTNWKLGDLCECGHAIEDHYALNKMPCSKCNCMELKKEFPGNDELLEELF